MANGMQMVLLCVLNESQNDAQKFLFLSLRHFPFLILLIKYLLNNAQINSVYKGVKRKNCKISMFNT